MLSLSAVSAGYGSFRALFDVLLEVPKGEAVGVIGPNGAGKTTLMRVISGLIRPTAGQIGMAGTDLLATPAHRILALGIVLGVAGASFAVALPLAPSVPPLLPPPLPP